MLTFNCARAASAWFIGAAVACSVVASTSARADGLVVGGCLRSWTSLNCVARWGQAGDPYVRIVPHDEADEARASARDHKWMSHCRPVIEQDHYGVARYHYAAPGCEFGVGAY